MATKVQLNNYTDFDRLLIPKNFLVTLLGAALAFSLSYFQFYVPLPVIPYNLLLASAMMIFVAIYTANLASASLVALVGSLGITAPGGGFVDFFLVYLMLNLVLCITLGYFSDKLMLVMRWTRFYLIMAAILAITFVVTGILSSAESYRYTDRGIPVGSGGDAGTGLGLPVVDIGVLVGLLLLVLIFALVLRGQMQLTSKSKKKYKIIGTLFVVLGQAIALAPLFLFSYQLTETVTSEIAFISNHTVLLKELFFHGNTFGILSSPVSIFFVMAISTVFTLIGVAVYTVGYHGGNLEGKRGSPDLAFLAAPIMFILYFVVGSYAVQNLAIQNGLFISIELFPVFAAGIWGVYAFNQLLARVILFLFRA